LKQKYNDRKWNIIKTSAINGQGLGMQWMISKIREIKRNEKEI